MTIEEVRPAQVDRDRLREQVSDKYAEVALTPERGFHFHTGRPLAAMLGYASEDVDWLPTTTVESFAGTGNPLSAGRLPEGARVLDVGCGAASTRCWRRARLAPRAASSPST